MNVVMIRSLVAAALLALVTSTTEASQKTVVGSENNVYETDGGNSGTPFFFNAQSLVPTGDDFREFGVIDFDGSAFFNADALSINSVRFKINDSGAFFANAGEVAFFLAGDNSGTLTDGRAAYLPSEAPNGVGAQFGALTSLGTADYTPLEDALDNFALTLDASAETQLIDLLNNGETIRLIVAGNDDTLAATWSGLTSFDYPIHGLEGPSLMIDANVIPEPTTMLLGLMGASMVGFGFRRRYS